MNLHEYQRSFVRASLSRDVSNAALAQLGDVERVRLYRNMIRSRFEDMARVAFRETLQGAVTLYAALLLWAAETIGPERSGLKPA